MSATLKGHRRNVRKIAFTVVGTERCQAFIVRISGGLHQLFVASLIAEGVPVVLILWVIWAFAYFAGAHVMQCGALWRCLLDLVLE